MSSQSEVIKALAKALPELESAKRNANSGAFAGKKYANLTAVMKAVEPVKEHGLWYRQVSHDNPNGACIETVYIHESGQELSAGVTFVKADKSTAQGFGSAITYARRYSLQSAFGLDAEDDDGMAASAPPPKQEKKSLDPNAKINDQTRHALTDLIIAAGETVPDFCREKNITALKDIINSQAVNFAAELKEKKAA